MTPEARGRRRVRTPVIAGAAVAWLVLAVTEWAAAAGPPASASVHGAHSHGVAEASVPFGGAAGVADLAAEGAGTPPQHGASAWAAGWLVMLVAMMGPTLIPVIRHVAQRSLPRQRVTLVISLIAGYALAWLLAGVGLTAINAGIRAALDPVGDPAPVLAGIVICLAWQASPVKQHSLNRHMLIPPLPARGRRSYLGALQMGGRHGLWCVGSCWALMLLPLLSPSGHLVVMAAVAAWIWAERFERPATPRWRIHVPTTALRILIAALRGLRLSAPTAAPARWP